MFRKPEPYLQKFPNELFWYFIIDQQFWTEGKYVFDNDASPGYFENATKGFLYTLSSIGSPLTLDWIIGIHDLSYHDQTNIKKLGLKKGATQIACELLTHDGLEELIVKILNQHLPLLILYSSPDETTFNANNSIFANNELPPKELANFVLQKIDAEQIKVLKIANLGSISENILCIQELIFRYHHEIEKAQTEKEKLQAIIRFVQDLHQLHPFADGNGRTFIFYLLFKLLIENNLTPSLVSEPAKFSTNSVEELVDMIIQGQETFLGLNTLEEDEKIESLQEYILRTTFFNTPFENFDYFYIDVKSALKLYEEDSAFKKSIDQDPTLIYEKIISFPRSTELLQELFEKIPPNDLMLTILYDKALEQVNVELFNEVVNLLPDNQITNLKTFKQLRILVQKNEMTMLKHYLIQPKFHWTNEELSQFLLDKYKNDQSYLHALLNNGCFGQIQILFSVMDNVSLAKLLSNKFDDENGYQLINKLGDKNLIYYVFSRVADVDQTPLTSAKTQLMFKPSQSEEKLLSDEKLQTDKTKKSPDKP